MSFEKWPHLALSLILLIAIIIYFNALFTPFIWDDTHLILSDKSIKELRFIPRIFSSTLYKDTLGGSNYYRPIQSLSFMIDWYMWKDNPFGYHLTNLIFHLINIVLVYLLIIMITGKKSVSIFASTLFAVHPINTEAVTYISGRSDPLCTVFFLSSVICYIKYRFTQHRIKTYLISSVFLFTLALLSRESALVLPLILILFDAVYIDNKLRAKSLMTYGLYFFVLFIYVFLRIWGLGFFFFIQRLPLYGNFTFLITKIVSSYFLLLTFPIYLHMERYIFVSDNILETTNLLSFIFVLLLFALLLIFYRRSRFNFFCLSWFFITLLPIMNILPLNATIAEHWLYIPSMGVYMLVSSFSVYILHQLLKEDKKIYLIVFRLFFIFLLSFFSIRTILRNMDWQRPAIFFAKLIHYSPFSARAHYSLGCIYMRRGYLDDAKEEFKKAAVYGPALPFGFLGLSKVAFLNDDYDTGTKYLKRALELNPFLRNSRDLMRNVLFEKNKRIQRLSKAVEQKPKNKMAHLRLAYLYLDYMLYFEAMDSSYSVLNIEPENREAHFILGWIFYKLGIITSAIEEFKYILSLNPDDLEAKNNLGICYAKLGRYDLARRQWEQVLLHNPDHPRAIKNLHELSRILKKE